MNRMMWMGAVAAAVACLGGCASGPIVMAPDREQPRTERCLPSIEKAGELVPSVLIGPQKKDMFRTIGSEQVPSRLQNLSVIDSRIVHKEAE